MVVVAACIFSFNHKERKLHIFSIGDSIMCNYDETYLSSFGGENYPIRGWMQMAPQFFTDEVEIHNAAVSGRSSKSFRDEGLWKAVRDSIQPGDYVFISFGANDQKTDSARHTEPRTTYRQNFIHYINETRASGGIPVLFTTIVRYKFNKDGKLIDTYGDYITVVRELAEEMNVTLVDLNKITWQLVEGLGPEESKKLFLNIEPGRFTKLPNGKHDDHLNIDGATKVAALATRRLKDLNIAISKYIR
jgi:lysophospholipase L1-like esterase